MYTNIHFHKYIFRRVEFGSKLFKDMVILHISVKRRMHECFAYFVQYGVYSSREIRFVFCTTTSMGIASMLSKIRTTPKLTFIILNNVESERISLTLIRARAPAKVG